MGLLSYFQRQRPSPDASTGAGAGAEPEVTPDAVAQARARALRRLVGASLLLAVGVIGFPLLFETQPRPIRLDVPIELVRKDAAAPPTPAVPAGKPMALPSAEPVPEPVAEAASAAKPATPMLSERAGDQGREVVVAAPAAASRTPTPPAAVAAASVLPVKPATTPATDAEAVRARALLEGQAATAAAVPATDAASAANAASRIVVQVGAYADADKLREVRSRVEKLGLKTYTQVVDNDGQKKTRVRVGPFATRPEADKTAARLRDAGLPVAVLTL